MSTLKPRMVPLSGDEKYTRLLAGLPETAGMKSGYVTLKPKEAVGEHKSSGREETIIFLAGTASVYCGNRLAFQAAAPSLVYIPPETAHDIRNETDSLLRYVYVVAPVPAGAA